MVLVKVSSYFLLCGAEKLFMLINDVLFSNIPCTTLYVISQQGCFWYRKCKLLLQKIAFSLDLMFQLWLLRPRGVKVSNGIYIYIYKYGRPAYYYTAGRPIIIRPAGRKLLYGRPAYYYTAGRPIIIRRAGVLLYGRPAVQW